MSHAPKSYPKLSEAQKDRLLADLLWEYALGNLRPVGRGEDIIPATKSTPEDLGA
jgi:hypothetical protein